MKRRIARILKWLAGGLALLVLLLVAALAFLLTTETAVRWAWSLGADYLPEGVSVEAVEGRLIGPLEVRGLQVETDGMRLALDRAELRWRPGDLLDGLAHVRLIRLEGLDYTALPADETPPQPEPGEPFELPEAIDLPVDVALDAFELDGASVRTGPEAEPFVIERAELAARLDGDNWQLDRLIAHGPLFRVDGSARVTARGRYANRAQIEWRANLPDLAPLEGATRLEGDLDALDVNQQVAAPYNLQASATVREPLEALRLEARIDLDGTKLAAIRSDLPEITLTAGADLEGTPEDLGFQLDARASEPQQGTAVADLAGRFTGNAVRIERLALTSPDTPGSLRASGRVALAGGNAMDLSLSWRDLQWPLAGAPQYRSPEGDFTLTGPLDDYRLDGGLQWSLAEQSQSGRLRLAGQGDLQSFDLAQLRLSGAPGELTGGANVVWAPALEASVRLDGKNLNPGAVVPDWPGDFDLKLRAGATQKPDGLHAQLSQLVASGSLRGQPLDVDAAATYGPAGAVIDRLRLLAGETRLRASGRVTEPMALDFALDSTDLGTTLPGAAGELHAEGRASGAYLQPEVNATLEADGLAYDDNRLGRLALDADVDWSGGQDSRLTVSAGEGEANGLTLNDLRLTANGRPGGHRIELAVDTSEGNADVGVDGDLDQAAGRWNFRLTEAHLAYRELDAWQLVQAADGSVSASAQQVEQACWASGEARLCLQGGRDAAGSRARFALEDFDFAYLASFLPPDMTLDGGLSASGEAEMPTDGNPRAEVQVRTRAGRLTVQGPEQEAVEVLRLEPGEIDASLAADGGLEARADLPLSQGGLQLDASVPGGDAPLIERPLDGRLSLRLDSLAFLPQLSPEISRASGRVDGDLTVSGTPGSPALDGRLALAAPELALATAGIVLEDLSLALVGAGQDVDIRASATSGGGTLDAEGRVGLGSGSPTVDMAVRGDAFQVLDNREARVFASPDLEIAVGDERIDVNGSLSIPRADITPRELPASGGVTVSGDQVIVRPGEDEGAEASVGGRDLHAEVRINVGDPDLRLSEFAQRGYNYDDVVRRLPGDKVRFEGFGMQAVLAGSLLVVQEPGQPATGSGELRIVVGQYKAYGQDLNIENGRVLFGGGPVTQPALDVRAVRRPREDLLVGVRVRGRLEQPEFSLFSEPSGMTQSEQLSWLVLGRSLAGASSAETSLVTKAALAIGLKGGNAVADNVRGSLGVDQFGIETDSSAGGSEQASLVVGKYLTPKLYVSYGVGLFNPVNTLRLRYTLSRLWRLETQSSGTATGGDLIYEIERGD